MKLNDIKFVPKANAFAEVYGKATGVPFIGEMMAAAAGNGSEPTPPTPSVVESVTIGAMDGGLSYDIICTTILNSDWYNEYAPQYMLLGNIYIKDANGNDLWEFYIDWSYGPISGGTYQNTGTLPEIPNGGNYSITVNGYDLQTYDETTLYEGTGTWTYEEL